MSKTHDRGRLDWLVEIVGAAAPAAAAGFAAAKLAPANDWPIATALLVGFGGMFGRPSRRCAPFPPKRITLRCAISSRQR